MADLPQKPDKKTPPPTTPPRSHDTAPKKPADTIPGLGHNPGLSPVPSGSRETGSSNIETSPPRGFGASYQPTVYEPEPGPTGVDQFDDTDQTPSPDGQTSSSGSGHTAIKKKETPSTAHKPGSRQPGRLSNRIPSRTDENGKQKGAAQVSKEVEAAKDIAQVVATRNVAQLGNMIKKAAEDEEYRKAFWRLIAGVVISAFFGCCGIPLMIGFALFTILSGNVAQNYMQARNLYKSCPIQRFDILYANDQNIPSFRNYGDECNVTSDDYWDYYQGNARSKEPIIEDKIIAAIDQAGLTYDGSSGDPLGIGVDNGTLLDCNKECPITPDTCKETVPAQNGQSSKVYERSPDCNKTIYPGADCSCRSPNPSHGGIIYCPRTTCVQRCANKNLKTMQRRSKTVAERIREIFEAEKTTATATTDGNGKTLPIFDSWRPDDIIDDKRMDVLCYLFFDFKEYKLNQTNSLDYSKCYDDNWVSRGFAETSLDPEDEALPCQPQPCSDPENCKCIPASTLGSLTAYKYMIGSLQTDRCKNCQNPFPSNVCQENGIDVDVDGNSSDCIKVPAWTCANCDCKDCNTLQSGGSVPTPSFALPSSYDLSGIPTDLQGPFGSAAAEYHISPQFLAAVFSGGEHGGNWPSSGPWAVGSSGDSGPFQFLECTWEGWNQPICKGGYGKADGVFETNQQIIDSIGGYGQDGNSDSLADVNSLYDSSFAAADYLALAGATNNGVPVTDIAKLHDAAAKYNGGRHWKSSMAQNYADRVMKVYNKLNNDLF